MTLLEELKEARKTGELTLRVHALYSELLKRPESFGWSGIDAMFRTWSLGPVLWHRDTPDGAQSRAAQRYKSLLKKFPTGVELVRTNHWAVGWCEHLTFHVKEDDSRPTEVLLEMVRRGFVVEPEDE